MTWRSIPDTVVYRWPGTRSVIAVFGSHSPGAGRYMTSFVLLKDEDEPSSSGFVFELSGADGEGRVVVRSDDRMSRVYSLVEQRQIRKMVLAFLVEIGVDRSFFGGIPISAYVTSADGVDMSWSELPRWVPDDLWDDRYDSVLQYISRDFPWVSPDEDWLGYVPSLQVRDDVDASAKWGWAGSPPVSFDTKKTAVADTLRDLVDAIIINEKLLPERDRERWLSENLVFGQFVVPRPDEVELYRVLGERLPLLWPTERLIDWLEERAGS